MKSRLKFIGMVAVVVMLGLSMSGCPTTNGNGGGSVDITGTWRGNIAEMTATITVTATNWTMTIPGFPADQGVLIRDGITARLFDSWGEIGTVVIIDNNTARLVLNRYAGAMQGTWTLTRV